MVKGRGRVRPRRSRRFLLSPLPCRERNSRADQGRRAWRDPAFQRPLLVRLLRRPGRADKLALRGSTWFGALADLGSHLVDLSEQLCGPIIRIDGAALPILIKAQPVPLGAALGHAAGGAVSDERAAQSMPFSGIGHRGQEVLTYQARAFLDEIGGRTDCLARRHSPTGCETCGLKKPSSRARPQAQQ